MSEVQLPTNSNLSKEQKNELPVEVKVRKKNELSKIAKAFFPEAPGDVKTYLVTDILIPSLKKLIYDIVTNGFNAILYGENGSKSSSSMASKVSYRKYYDDKQPSYSSTRYEARVKDSYDYDDIIFNTRDDAELILKMMEEAIDKYQIVTVDDYYDFVRSIYKIRIDSTHTDRNYGWISLRGTNIVRNRSGWVIDFPKISPID